MKKILVFKLLISKNRKIQTFTGEKFLYSARDLFYNIII